MKVVIIEDERITAEDLRQTIRQADPAIEIITILRSVKEGVDWFMSNPTPDLIFSDIQLGDGLSFEILRDLCIPVIFCTAYDEYALNAFRTYGIDYILKPFNLATVTAALVKFNKITQVKQEEITRQYESIKRLFTDSRSAKNSSLLIRFKDTILPIKIDDIALFRLEREMVSLFTFDKTMYHPGKSLDELEAIVGDDFFRVNRQYLVNRKAIINASSLFSHKLSLSVSVPVKESITISKEKAPVFLRWLSGKIE